MHRLSVLLAIVCSLLLTYLTVTPPLIPTDWARLDATEVYVPQRVNYAWPSYAVQVGLWGGTIGFLWTACRQGFKTPGYNEKIGSPLKGLEKISSQRCLTIFMVAGLILIGFGLRLHTLDALPLIMDEIGFAARASDMLHGQRVPILAPGHNANPAVYSWLVALAMGVFGQNAFASRLIPLAFGTLSIPAIYALGRAWWSRRVGLLAAAFLATYPAHIHFSRMSLHNIVDPFFVMLALTFLARGIQNPLSRRDWVMAGIMAGIAQYFYHGSRLAIVLVVVYMGLSAVSRQQSAKTKNKDFTTVPFPVRKLTDGDMKAQRTQRENIRTGYIVSPPSIFAFVASWRLKILWMMLGFGLVTLPQFTSMIVQGLPLTGNEQALRLPPDLGGNSLRAILAWVGQKDVSPFWLSDASLLEWPALLAFAVGVLVSLRRWRDPRYAVLIVSIVLTTIWGAIPTATPLYVRYMAIVPAMALLVAIGLSAVSRQQNLPFGSYARWLRTVKDKIFTTETQRAQRESVRTRYSVSLQIAAIVLIGLQGIYAALGHPGEALKRVSASQWIEDDLARQAAELPEGAAAVLVVPPDFSDVQMITVAHYVAAYGERRLVVVNRDDEQMLTEQLRSIKTLPYTVLKPR